MLDFLAYIITTVGIVLFYTVLFLPTILWLKCEFDRTRPWVRVLLGCSTWISVCIVVSAFMNILELSESHYRNQEIRWTIKNLIDSTVTGLESGKEREVLAELKEMQAKYDGGRHDWCGYEHPINEMAYEYAEKFPADDEPDNPEPDNTSETENTD